MEIGNLPNTEFKVLIIKMIKEFGRRMDQEYEKFISMYGKTNTVL